MPLTRCVRSPKSPTSLFKNQTVLFHVNISQREQASAPSFCTQRDHESPPVLTLIQSVGNANLPLSQSSQCVCAYVCLEEAPNTTGVVTGSEVRLKCVASGQEVFWPPLKVRIGLHLGPLASLLSCRHLHSHHDTCDDPRLWSGDRGSRGVKFQSS